MNKKEFQHRRKRVMDMMGDSCIAILPTASVKIRNNDVEFPFRPDSDFYYLTGYPEPAAVAVLIPDNPQKEFILFCRKRDAKLEQWHGSRAGLEGACDIYGADIAFPIEDMDDILPNLLENRERIFYTMGNNTTLDHQILDWVNKIRNKGRNGINAPCEFISLAHILHDMRLYKSRHEISLMRKAAKISAAAHKQMMKVCAPGMMEYQIEATFIHQCMQQGTRNLAYPSIVGGGANSCILHYTDNNCLLQDGDLLLIDAGAEYQYYASDITRTFPVNGQFTNEQRIIYELVLRAQSVAIEKVMHGNHWDEPHQVAVAELTQGLLELGILKGDIDSLIKQQAYSKYYLHRTGHWLGMDVHDVGDYKVSGHWRMLEPGMVLTIEPGLYLPPNTRGLAKKWWGIGIRIEDSVLVTKGKPDILSKNAPKQINEIESLMASTNLAME